MAPRATWKGFLKIGELTCPVALHAAASTAERIRFHTINRETGHRVQRQFVDQETGRVVASDDQVKGYEVSKGEYVILEPEEVTSLIPQGDKTLDVEAFVEIGKIDKAFFDRPYYLTPSDPVAEKAFVLIREALEKENVAAVARALLFRKMRTVLVRPEEGGLAAITLNYDYEVRAAEDVFKDLRPIKITGEMLGLAKHIIETKRGKFDPSTFDDRYEAALAELVKAKMEGKPLPERAAPEPTNVVNLMDALRQSAGATAGIEKRAAGGAKGRAKTASAEKPAKKPAAKSKRARTAAETKPAPRRKAG